MQAVLLMAAAGPVVAPGPVEPVVIDLLVRPPCEQTDATTLASEIVVCAERTRQSYHGVAPSRRAGGKALPKAEVQLAQGAALALETESADLGMARSQRAMIRLKFKF
jgi:hypothetical protein